MRTNLLKQVVLALLLTMAVPYVKAQVAHVGDILCTNGAFVSPAGYANSGLEAMGIIFYVDASGQHGWAIALEDEGSFKWSNNSATDPLPLFSSKRAAIYDLDGLYNTQEMIEYIENSTNNYTYPAFEAMDLSNGWYLPAIGQLNYLYGNLVEVNAGLAVAGGTLFNMTDSWSYWSSTQGDNSGNAWYLKSSGNIASTCKYCTGSEFLVRGVHNF